MPIIKSAEKALRQNKRRRRRNTFKIKELKATLKEEYSLFSENKKEEAKKLLPKTYKLLDKAARAGIIKKKTASRKKSRLTRALNK